MKLAPIALFVYKRLHHARQTIESLMANSEARSSDLYVFSDGPKNEADRKQVDAIRTYVKSVSGFNKITIIERETNIGLAQSIISGVTEIVNRSDRVIVLEDDLVVSPYFLKFMNEALQTYEKEPRVMHISGYMFPIDPNGLPQTFFYRSTSCWGWATWSRAWIYFNRDINAIINQFSGRMIREFNIDGSNNFWSQIIANRRGTINTWAIFWYATVFLRRGLCLHPARSLVQNIGHDNSGVHCGITNVFDVQLHAGQIEYFEKIIEENSEVLKRVKIYHAKCTPSLSARLMKKISAAFGLLDRLQFKRIVR